MMKKDFDFDDRKTGHPTKNSEGILRGCNGDGARRRKQIAEIMKLIILDG